MMPFCSIAQSVDRERQSAQRLPNDADIPLCGRLGLQVRIAAREDLDESPAVVD